MKTFSLSEKVYNNCQKKFSQIQLSVLNSSIMTNKRMIIKKKIVESETEVPYMP